MKSYFSICFFVCGLCLTCFTQNTVEFTLHNETPKSILLRIPNVMNPNLSPFSNSGVTLKVGQKIFFYTKGKKKELLLIVTEAYKGQKIKVGKLIRARRKTLAESLSYFNFLNRACFA